MQNSKEVKLKKGAVDVYEFENAKLHAYQSNDLMSDTVFILEKSGKTLIIEQPCFFDNISELSEYINSLNADVKSKILSYHMAGGTFFAESPVYATKKADEYAHKGSGKAMIDDFTKAFGASFDSSLSNVTDIINAGKNKIADTAVNIIETGEAFDIEFPEINTIYTHMLGSDTHSIIAGKEHADALIKQLIGFIDKKYTLILSSHHMPETLEDVKIKIGYIEEIKKIADACKNADDFKTAAKKSFPNYFGENYLDMSAEFFFPSK